MGVFLERGCGADLLINILLTILGYIPGIIHALYVLTTLQLSLNNVIRENAMLTRFATQLHYPQVLIN